MTFRQFLAGSGSLFFYPRIISSIYPDDPDIHYKKPYFDSYQTSLPTIGRLESRLAIFLTFCLDLFRDVVFVVLGALVFALLTLLYRFLVFFFFLGNMATGCVGGDSGGMGCYYYLLPPYHLLDTKAFWLEDSWTFQFLGGLWVFLVGCR